MFEPVRYSLRVPYRIDNLEKEVNDELSNQIVPYRIDNLEIEISAWLTSFASSLSHR